MNMYFYLLKTSMLSTACENHSNMVSLMLVFVFGDVLYIR